MSFGTYHLEWSSADGIEGPWYVEADTDVTKPIHHVTKPAASHLASFQHKLIMIPIWDYGQNLCNEDMATLDPFCYSDAFDILQTGGNHDGQFTGDLSPDFTQPTMTVKSKLPRDKERVYWLSHVVLLNDEVIGYKSWEFITLDPCVSGVMTSTITLAKTETTQVLLANDTPSVLFSATGSFIYDTYFNTET